MLKVFVLVVISGYDSGRSVSFQEFNSYENCNKNAIYLQNLNNISVAYCTDK